MSVYLYTWALLPFPSPLSPLYNNYHSWTCSSISPWRFPDLRSPWGRTNQSCDRQRTVGRWKPSRHLGIGHHPCSRGQLEECLCRKICSGGCDLLILWDRCLLSDVSHWKRHDFCSLWYHGRLRCLLGWGSLFSFLELRKFFWGWIFLLRLWWQLAMKYGAFFEGCAYYLKSYEADYLHLPFVRIYFIAQVFYKFPQATLFLFAFYLTWSSLL